MHPSPHPRTSGLLLHVTSLPSPFGIGDLGPTAYAWITTLASAKQTWWQILPLGPPGAGHSPYQCYSAFAGNPNLISPDLLFRDNLLTRADLRAPRFHPDRIDFELVTAFKTQLLTRAFERFSTGSAPALKRAFKTFRSTNADWLDDFTLFMALRERFGGVSWTDWPRDLVRRVPRALHEAKRALAKSIDQHAFTQFLFYRQLDALRAHAHSHGVKLIGDLPIFVSPDSADVWSRPDLFLLYPDGRPKSVAGVPPDLFAVTGQRWGNPLYNWRAMKRDKYAWWVHRLRATLKQVDLVRIDHFRGFAGFWQIPASAPTAETGKWTKAPGAGLFATLQKKLGHLPFIAEDLGVITPDVERLRDSLHLPGMRVLQFGFGGGSDSIFLPHQFIPNCIAYTGTHDNDTTVGWYKSLDKNARAHLHAYAPDSAKDPAGALIRLTWASVANTAIAPVQDILRLGNEARMNLPGTATGNWSWRMRDAAFQQKHIDELIRLTETFNRAPRN